MCQEQESKQNKENDRKEMLDSLGSVLSSSSSHFSEVARTIVIALCALSWVEYSEIVKASVSIKCDPYPLIVIFIVIAYFTIELLQYAIPAIYARCNFVAYRDKGKSYDKVRDNMDRVSNTTMIFVGIKFVMIISMVVLLLIHFCNKGFSF